MLHGTWILPRPGIESVSPALAGGFLSTALPEMSSLDTFKIFSLLFYNLTMQCLNLSYLVYIRVLGYVDVADKIFLEY